MLDYSELAAIRLGYGLSPIIASPADPQALLDTIANAAPEADDIRMPEASEFQLALREARKNDADNGTRTAREVDLQGTRRGILALRQRIARAVGDPGGFGERLVQFWSDHFTVRAGNSIEAVQAAAFVTEAIRPHINGRFVDMMYAAETHPRMLIYLDQRSSVGPNSRISQRRPERNLGLNENLAREMIELHSLGVGADYTQTDVRELAELLTGLTFDPKSEANFDPNRAEPGSETVLGFTYGSEDRARIEDIRAVINDLAAHEATAGHLARKMAVHFVADDPPKALVDRLKQAFIDSGGDLFAMNRTLAEAPELASTFRQKVRQPFDFMVASLRAVGFDRERVMDLEQGVMRRQLRIGLITMGQPWGLPRGPDGWPEAAEAWATPQGIAARTDWAIRELPKLREDLPDPRTLMTAALGSTASESLQWAVPKAESAREGIAIVLASSDFNRR